MYYDLIVNLDLEPLFCGHWSKFGKCWGWIWKITVNALRSHCQPRLGAIVLWALKQIWEVSIVITMGLLKWLIYQVYTILLDQFPSPWIIWFYEPYAPHFCTSSDPQPTVVTSIYHNVFIKGNETMLQTIYFFINDIIENQG